MFRLNHLFKQADAVQRYLAAPLTRSRLAYLAHRAEQGAKSSTLRGIAALQVKVIHYLEVTAHPPASGFEVFVTVGERSGMWLSGMVCGWGSLMVTGG